MFLVTLLRLKTLSKAILKWFGVYRNIYSFVCRKVKSQYYFIIFYVSIKLVKTCQVVKPVLSPSFLTPLVLSCLDFMVNMFPLTKIIKLSFQHGIFPNTLKNARVIILYKSRPKNDPVNHLPMIVFSKLIRQATNSFLTNSFTFYFSLFLFVSRFSICLSTNRPA